MAWIKINKWKFINIDSIEAVTRLQNEDGSYYIKFLIARDEFYTTKCFEQLEKCEEIFDKLWRAMSKNKSLDISENK